MKRIISILLCAVMLLSVIPMTISAAEGDVLTLYTNEFDSSKNLNGGTSGGYIESSTSADNKGVAYYADGKGLRLGNGEKWTEPVALDNNSGAIVVTMRYYNNDNKGPALSINGVEIAGGNSSGHPTIGGVAQISSQKAWRVITLTVTISDLSTGVASVSYKESYGTVYTSTVTVGEIKDSITLKAGAMSNSWKVDSISVTQVDVAEVEPEQPEEPVVIPTDLFSTGEKAYSNAANQSDTYTVKANGTDGLITIVFSYPQTSWQRKTNIFRVNGKTLLLGNGTHSNPGYSLGDDATVYNTWNGRTITIVIDPLTGDATVSDNASHSATANVGVIGETFTLTVGEDYANGWTLTSLDVTQVAGELPKEESVIWVDGYQMSPVENGVYNVRFAAILSEIPTGSNNVGFEISAPAFDKEWDLNTTSVYRAITANFGTESIVATDRGGEYITAAAITDIPAETGAIEFVITPYITVAGAKVYGEAVTVTVPAAQ